MSVLKFKTAIMSALIVPLLAIHLGTAALGADDPGNWIPRDAGSLVPQCKKIIIGEVKSVSWEADGDGPERAGKATFVILEAIRGGKKGDQIILPVRYLDGGPEVNDTNSMWVGRNFATGSRWLLFVGSGNNNDAIIRLAERSNVDDSVMTDLAKAVAIYSKEQDERLKAIREILAQKSLKPVLLVNFGIESAASLFRKDAQVMSLLLSVAAEPTNSFAVRQEALSEISGHFPSGRLADERPLWLAECRMLLETTPKMKDSPLELLYVYSNIITEALRKGSKDGSVSAPADLKLESAESVSMGLASLAANLDQSLPALKDKLATVRDPATEYPAEYRRAQLVGDLESSITETEHLSAVLKTLAKSVASHAAAAPPATQPAMRQ